MKVSKGEKRGSSVEDQESRILTSERGSLSLLVTPGIETFGNTLSSKFSVADFISLKRDKKIKLKSYPVFFLFRKAT